MVKGFSLLTIVIVLSFTMHILDSKKYRDKKIKVLISIDSLQKANSKLIRQNDSLRLRLKRLHRKSISKL